MHRWCTWSKSRSYWTAHILCPNFWHLPIMNHWTQYMGHSVPICFVCSVHVFIRAVQFCLHASWNASRSAWEKYTAGKVILFVQLRIRAFRPYLKLYLTARIRIRLEIEHPDPAWKPGCRSQIHLKFVVIYFFIFKI